MLRRTLTAVLLIPPVIYLIGWAPKWLFLLALVVTVEIGLFEFFTLSRQAGFKALPALGFVAGGAVCLIPLLNSRQPAILLMMLVVLLVLLTPSFALRWSPDLKDYLAATATTVFGILYVSLLLSCLLPLRFSEPAMGGKWLTRGGVQDSNTGRMLLLLLFLVIWAGDISAYLVGRTVGRRLLIPRISPKKTVEGALGGLAGSLLMAWLFTYWWWQTAELKAVMLLAGLVALSGQMGDLVESALKRAANLKDSGTLLPGHGGLLDRIDSLLFGAPVLWLALALRDLWG
jgi:phosphatidate cytidylyltransferase